MISASCSRTPHFLGCVLSKWSRARGECLPAGSFFGWKKRRREIYLFFFERDATPKHKETGKARARVFVYAGELAPKKVAPCVCHGDTGGKWSSPGRRRCSFQRRRLQLFLGNLAGSETRRAVAFASRRRDRGDRRGILKTGKLRGVVVGSLSLLCLEEKCGRRNARIRPQDSGAPPALYFGWPPAMPRCGATAVAGRLAPRGRTQLLVCAAAKRNPRNIIPRLELDIPTSKLQVSSPKGMYKFGALSSK